MFNKKGLNFISFMLVTTMLGVFFLTGCDVEESVKKGGTKKKVQLTDDWEYTNKAEREDW